MFSPSSPLSLRRWVARVTISFAILLLAGCASAPIHPARGVRPPTPPIRTSPGTLGKTASPRYEPADAKEAFQSWLQGDFNEVASFLEKHSIEEATPLALFLYAELALQRGQYQAATQRLVALLLKAPDHSLAPLASMRLWESRHFPGSFEEIIRPLLTQIDEDRITPDARLWIARLNVHLHSHDAATDARVTPELLSQGHPSTWHIVGPFGDQELTDFELQHPPKEDPFLAESYEHEEHTLQREQKRFSENIGGSWTQNGVYFLETTFSASEEIEVIVSLRSGLRISASIDGQPLLERDTTRGYPALEQAPLVRLSPGIHRIRVKLGVAGSGSQFALQILPTRGPLSSSILTPAPHTSTTLASSKVAEKLHFQGGLSNDLNKLSPFELWQAALWAEQSGDFDRGHRAIEELEILAPKFSQIHLIAADLLRNDSALDPHTGLDRALSHYQSAITADPHAGHAFMMRGFLRYHEQQLEDALADLDAMLNLVPNEFLPHYYRYLILDSLDWTPLAEKSLRTAFNFNPSSCGLATLLSEVNITQMKHPTPSNTNPASLYCPNTQRTLIDEYYLPRGHFEGAKNTHRNLYKQNPKDPENLVQLSNTLAAEGSLDSAVEVLRVAAERGADENIIERVDLLIASQRRDEAMELLNAALDEHPTSLELIEFSRLFGGGRPLEELRIDGMALIQDYLADEKGYTHAGFYLLDYAAFRYYPDGSSLAVTHQISQVLNKAGIQSFGEVHIPSDAIITQLRTIKADGTTTIEPEEIPNKSSISMPNLAVGDFIEVEYLQAAPPSNPRDGRFIAPRWYFQVNNAPLIHSEFVVEIPKDITPLIDTRSTPPEPIITEHGDFKRYQFLMRETLPTRQEPHAPSPAETTISLQLAHGITLEQTRRAYRNNLLRVARPSPYLEEALQQALAEVQRDDRAAVTKALFEFVAEEINPEGNLFGTAASWIWTRKKGNPIALLKTLLDMAGVPNEIILVKPFGAMKRPLGIPSLAQHNKVLLKADVGEGRSLWLDATNPNNPFDYVHPTLQGQPYISLNADPLTSTSDKNIVRLYDPKREQQIVHFDIAIDEMGNINASGKEISDGFRGANLRRFIDQIKDDPEKVNLVLEQFLIPFFRVVEIKDFSFDGLKGTGEITVNYKFNAPEFVRKDEKTLTFQAAIYSDDLVKNYASLNKREQDLLLNIARETSLSMRFSLPPKAKFSRPPEPIKIETPFGAFSRKTKIEDGTLIVDDHFILHMQRIPAEKYPEFLDFAKKIDAAQIIHFEGTLKK